MLYLLFFCSGVSGLIYQVVWVRAFGNVFGNTVYSTSLVVAIFMLGLGAGGYLGGAWADRRYQRAPDSLLRAYGLVECLIAALALVVTIVLPALGALTARTSWYVAGEHGWFVLSRMSYLVRGAIAFALLAPITMLMGGTLTLLIRDRVRRDVETESGWTIALLYTANTAGAAAGAFLTDFVLVPVLGLLATQFAAVALNAIAGTGALWLAGKRTERGTQRSRGKTHLKGAGEAEHAEASPGHPHGLHGSTLAIAAALAASGFAAMGMEILWLRHFTLLLGGFRAVFSLVLTVMLVGIGLGSLAGGAIDRRTANPARALMLVQALLVLAVLGGLATASVSTTNTVAQTMTAALTPFERWMRDVWFDLRPILIEIGLPSILMGSSFPLANAIIQHAERLVGRRAGALYLANTAGGVCGAIVAGFVLLPAAGMQGGATTLMTVAALAIVPIYFASRTGAPAAARAPSTTAAALALSLLAPAAAIGAWSRLPADYVLRRSLVPPRPGEVLLDVNEGVNEIIAVTEVSGRGRGLITNGHPMSSTARLDQRYMRALAHIPLLSMERPARVLVIGFGVGNTTHAATLHPTVERVDVADLSRQVLEHARYFRDANGGVLDDRRVAVFVNDGRQHLLMQPEHTYDLITLEPPPIAHAGVGSLYSREFYALARSRLKPGGYVSQWLPAYQVPPETSLAMIRAFVDLFPQSVLLSGMQAELLLVGTTAGTIDIDPDRLAAALRRAPAAEADLRRLDLGSVKEIAGTFVGSAETMTQATRDSPAVSDDRPLQEYVVRSTIGSAPGGVPASIFDLAAIGTWCPRCVDGVPGLEIYLELLQQAYHAADAAPLAASSTAGDRRLLGSAYLGAVVPDTDAVHNVLGVALLQDRRYAEAADAFREALKRRGDSPDANRNLGTALAASGHEPEAVGYLRRAVQLQPGNGAAQYELGSLLLERREFAEAADCFRAALRTLPDSAATHNNLGVSLASMGDLQQAIDQFQQAVALDPTFEEGRRNLASAQRRQTP